MVCQELCGKLTTRCDVVKNVVARLSQKAAAHSALKQVWCLHVFIK